MTRRVLGVFAKEPIPGRVKTRLARETSPAWAACLAEAILLDLIAELDRVEAERILAHAPPEAEPYFRRVVPRDWRFEAQSPGDLGARLQWFFAQRFAEGADQVIVVGSDCPMVGAHVVDEAFANLMSADVVVGPAEDGGYYLIGCVPPLPPIFNAMPWSTETVLAETCARLERAGRRARLLPVLLDVDTRADWHATRHWLRTVSERHPMPRTEALAAEQDERAGASEES
jgi:rSAM/selenodomain-associated transferase 1